MRQTGHRSPAMLEVYAREHAPLIGQRRHPPRPLSHDHHRTTSQPAAQALSPRTVRTYAAGLGAVHRLVPRHRAAVGAARGPGHRVFVPHRLPRRTGHPAAPGRRHRPPPHQPRTYPPPGQITGGAGRARPTRPPNPTAHLTSSAAVAAALRGLPSHGWTQGMFGRRDRCLLVLSQLAGVPYRHLATVTAGDVTLVDGIATIRTPAGEWTFVRPTTACCAGGARSSGGWRSSRSRPPGSPPPRSPGC